MSYAEIVFKYAVEFYTYSCEMLTNVTGVSYTVQTRPISGAKGSFASAKGSFASAKGSFATYPKLDRFHIEYAVRYVALLQSKPPPLQPTSIHDMAAVDRLYDMIRRIVRNPTFELTTEAELYLSRLTQIRDHTEPGSISISRILNVVQMVYECGAVTCDTYLGSAKSYVLDTYHFDEAATLVRPRILEYTPFSVAWSNAIDNQSRQSVASYAAAMEEIDSLPTFENRTQEAIKHYAAYVEMRPIVKQ